MPIPDLVPPGIGSSRRADTLAWLMGPAWWNRLRQRGPARPLIICARPGLCGVRDCVRIGGFSPLVTRFQGAAGDLGNSQCRSLKFPTWLSVQRAGGAEVNRFWA